MNLAIATDHAGYFAKEQFKDFLAAQGHVVKDYGTHDQSSCDYPDFAQAAAEAVAEGKHEMGILVCGAGIGMSIAANKVPGIRAGLCHDLYTAHMARAHNDANILVIPARMVALPLAEEIIKIFLSTPWEGGRHAARLKKIEEMEKKYNK